jgi:hypothetical protein
VSFGSWRVFIAFKTPIKRTSLIGSMIEPTARIIEDAMHTTISSPAQPDRTALGIACGMGAGALWGLVFLAPELVRAFTPLQLAIGRYLAYGAMSAVLLAPRWRVVFPLLRRSWGSLLWLALAGNTLYYVLLSQAIQTGGIAMTSLVIGFLPVAVTIIGSRESGAVPLNRLALSLVLCAGAAVCIGWQALSGQRSLMGLLCAIGALVSWTAYAVGNSHALARLPHVSVQDWNLLTGLVTGGAGAGVDPARHDDDVHASRCAGMGTVCRRIAGGGGAGLGGGKHLVEPDEPSSAADHGGPDDPVRNAVRAALRLCVGRAFASCSGSGGLRSGGGQRAFLCGGASAAGVTRSLQAPARQKQPSRAWTRRALAFIGAR